MLSFGYTIHVNHDGICGAYNFGDSFIQRLSEKQRYSLTDYYNTPYTVFGEHFHKVLVLGAGARNDVAAALRHGAMRVDAVEIIQQFLTSDGSTIRSGPMPLAS